MAVISWLHFTFPQADRWQPQWLSVKIKTNSGRVHEFAGAKGSKGGRGIAGGYMYIGYIGPIQSGAKPSTWLRLVTSATCAYEWHYTLWHGAVRGFSRFKSCELRIMHCNGSHSDYSTLTRWYGNRFRFELHSCDAGK